MPRQLKEIKNFNLGTILNVSEKDTPKHSAVFSLNVNPTSENGILTSITLETYVLSKQMSFNIAFKTAIGMSLVSMISMEVAMNVTDVIFTGGAILTWWVIPLMLIAGFITPLPYNYWRLKALGKGCH